MMYPYMTLNDDTEITHSQIIQKDGQEQVKVYIETPVWGGFHSATCWLPEQKWENIEGYSDTEMEKFRKLVRNNAHLMMEFARNGGILNNGN